MQINSDINEGDFKKRLIFNYASHLQAANRRKIIVFVLALVYKVELFSADCKCFPMLSFFSSFFIQKSNNRLNKGN